MSNQKQFGLHDSYGYWINRLANAFTEAFDHTIGHLGVTPQQWVVLISCYNGDAQTPAELSRFIGIDASAITRLLDRIEAKGLLVRVPDRLDRRSIKVELTDKGRALTPRLAALAQQVNEEFLSGMPASEAAQLKATILKMLENAAGAQR